MSRQQPPIRQLQINQLWQGHPRYILRATVNAQPHATYNGERTSLILVDPSGSIRAVVRERVEVLRVFLHCVIEIESAAFVVSKYISTLCFAFTNLVLPSAG